MLPLSLEAVGAPPLKCQGIKTDLVPTIARSLRWDGAGRWVEPFCGSLVVALNLGPQRALVADRNPHIVAFYRALREGRVHRDAVTAHLTAQGALLLERGESHYYEVRQRFNQGGDPLDFLFLNRACFNGVMRFNGKGGFNVPFCRKPDRFRRAHVTRIANQVDQAAQRLGQGDWEILEADWRVTLDRVREGDFVYLDPPYVGRHADYYNTWSDADAVALSLRARELPCGVALSMWLENRFRKNSHVAERWAWMERIAVEHFYHVGATEDLRHPMVEGLLVKPGYLTGPAPARPPRSAAGSTPPT